MSVAERIGRNLRKARERLGLSRSAVAARTFLTEEELAAIENGTVKVDYETAIRIEDELSMRRGESRRGVEWDSDRMTMTIRLAD